MLQPATLLHILEIPDSIPGLKIDLPASYIVWAITATPGRDSNIIFNNLLFAIIRQ
jgi:hypothetical protein